MVPSEQHAAQLIQKVAN